MTLPDRTARHSLLRLLGALTLATAALAALTGCTIATPYRAGSESAPPSPDARRVVVITHAVLDRQARAEFDRQTRRVAESLRGQPGLIGYSLRRELLGDEVWTMTEWRDEAARARFVASPIHREAMAGGASALRSVRFARIELPAAQLPLTWSRALELLEQHERSYGAAAEAR